MYSLAKLLLFMINDVKEMYCEENYYDFEKKLTKLDKAYSYVNSAGEDIRSDQPKHAAIAACEDTFDKFKMDVYGVSKNDDHLFTYPELWKGNENQRSLETQKTYGSFFKKVEDFVISMRLKIIMEEK